MPWPEGRLFSLIATSVQTHLEVRMGAYLTPVEPLVGPKKPLGFVEGVSVAEPPLRKQLTRVLDCNSIHPVMARRYRGYVHLDGGGCKAVVKT